MASLRFITTTCTIHISNIDERYTQLHTNLPSSLNAKHSNSHSQNGNAGQCYQCIYSNHEWQYLQFVLKFSSLKYSSAPLAHSNSCSTCGMIEGSKQHHTSLHTFNHSVNHPTYCTQLHISTCH